MPTLKAKPKASAKSKPAKSTKRRRRFASLAYVTHREFLRQVPYPTIVENWALLYDYHWHLGLERFSTYERDVLRKWYEKVKGWMDSGDYPTYVNCSDIALKMLRAALDALDNHRRLQLQKLRKAEKKFEFEYAPLLTKMSEDNLRKCLRQFIVATQFDYYDSLVMLEAVMCGTSPRADLHPFHWDLEE